MLRTNRNRRKLKRSRSDKLLTDLRRLEIEESLEDDSATVLQIPRSRNIPKTQTPQPLKPQKMKRQNEPMAIGSFENLRDSQVRKGFKKKRSGKENVENQNSQKKNSNSKEKKRFKFLKDVEGEGEGRHIEEVVPTRTFKINNVDFYNRNMVREIHTTNNFLTEKIVRSSIENR